MPDNALDLFVEERLKLILDNVRQKLAGITFEEFDTSAALAKTAIAN